jgi:peroxiredoxin
LPLPEPALILPAVFARILALSLLIAFATACEKSSPEPVRPSAAAPPAAAPVEPQVSPEDAPAISRVASRPNERPIPSFEGRTLDGERLSISSLIGKRFLVFFFNPSVPTARDVGKAVSTIAALRRDHNFEVLGVAIGASTSLARGFAKELKLDFPIINDSSGAIARRLNLRAPVTLIGADNEGYLNFAMANFDPLNARAMVEERLFEVLRIPAPGDAEEGSLGGRPKAPDFTATWLKGGAPFEFAEVAGKPAVLIFFLHTCPHCHKALAFLKEQLAALPEAQRPELIAISAVDRGSEVTAALAEEGLDFFPVLLDPGQKIQREYGVFGGFPDLLLINKEREIVHRVQGWHEGRDPALTRMLLAQIAGARVPMLLNPKGYTGSDVCTVCHTLEHDTWQFTKHATAFDTLVTHSADRDPECVSCHVVGFEKPGGFSMAERPAHLENVGCESCHGRGGPHLTPDFVKAGNYAPVCETCHNKEHSLGFDYEDFRPAISHVGIAGLSNHERAELVSGRARPGTLLPTSADFVGSDACQSCHAGEFETWSKSRHASAGQTIDSAQKGDNQDCLACHTTGFDMPGGFAKGSHIEIGGDLSRVGCESCHGPGGDHVEEGSAKLGSILSLGDKCDSCVIMKVCGSCHDPVNDPGFEFDVESHIDRQRHGTIEAGTGKKLEAQTHALPGHGGATLGSLRSSAIAPQS